MRYSITVYFDPHQNLWADCYLYAGLCALSASDEIDLTFRPLRHRTEPIVTVLEVRNITGKRVIAFDHYDRADCFNPAVLELCDVYYKRSYHEPAVLERAQPLHEKVRPYGLVFPCHIAGSRSRVLRALALPYVLGAVRIVNRLQFDYRGLHSFLASPDLNHFVYQPQEPHERVVSFQTRLWTPGDTTDDADEVNNERVAIVRALRKSFGPRFHGGIVPTPYALAQFPDVVTANDCNRTRHVDQAKRCMISVYTRGLHHSLAYKLPEYLAASQCIVSPSFRNQLPVSLDPERHYLAFRSPDECVDQCTRLFDDRDLAAAMSRANYQYFLDHVHPAAAIRRCLNDAFRPAAASKSSDHQLTTIH